MSRGAFLLSVESRPCPGYLLLNVIVLHRLFRTFFSDASPAVDPNYTLLNLFLVKDLS